MQPSSEKLLLAVDGNWHGDPEIDNAQRVKDFGALSPIWETFHRTLPLKAQGLCGRQRRKTVRARNSDWLQVIVSVINTVLFYASNLSNSNFWNIIDNAIQGKNFRNLNN